MADTEATHETSVREQHVFAQLGTKRRAFSACVKDYSNSVGERNEERRDRGPNDPIQVPKRWLYVPAIVLVGIVELMLNYNAFLDNFGVLFIALGAAFLVGFVVAMASHVHGTWAKQKGQREWYADGSWWLATVGLVLALALVTGVRYTWLDGLIDRGLQDVTVWPKVLQTLLMNLLVWLAGAVLAWFQHDKNKTLAKVEKERRKSLKALKAAKTRFEREITKQEEEHGPHGVGAGNRSWIEIDHMMDELPVDDEVRGEIRRIVGVPDELRGGHLSSELPEPDMA